MDKLHNLLLAACKVVVAGNRTVLQPEDRAGSSIKDVREAEICRNVWHRNGWGPWTSRAQMTGRFICKPNFSFQKLALMNSILSELMNSILSELTNTVRNRC